jgi:acyl-CoA reductase-like NAD-dependent aldehyde dehydrogenase
MTTIRVEPDSLDVIEPATGTTLASVPTVAAEELPDRVRQAQRAAIEWQAFSLDERASLLARVAEAIDDRADELARLETRNVGKPIAEARGEVALAARTFKYYAGAIDKHFGQTFPSGPSALHYTERRPFGVVGAIVPWNFPLVLASWKIAPALAAGNAIIVKPAALTPLTALLLEDICREVGIPAKTVQILPGPGGSLGRAIVEHPAIRKLSFTGSSEVGRDIFQRGAAHIKRLTLELGGKAPNVIFADADLDRALNAAISACFANGGQDCCSRARILVERTVYQDALDQLAELVRSIKVGDPLTDDTEMGPLVSETQRATCLDYVSSARQEGARVVCGGDALDREGWFMSPALLADVDSRMRAVREEIFGPVAALQAFDDEADAIAQANDTEYGLSASVWTNDAGRAVRVARAIEAGVVSINTNNSVHLTAPFGGVKASGLGRELGMEALDAYTELKTIYHAI